MAQPSEQTKKTSSSLMNKVSSGLSKIIGRRERPTEQEISPAKILGTIYEMMVKKEEERQLHDELQHTYGMEEKNDLQRRHEEIIKVLTARRPTKQKPTKEPGEAAPKEVTAPKTPETKVTPKAEPVKTPPKVETKPPAQPIKEAPKPPTAAPTPPTVAKPSISTAAKVAAGTAVVTGALVGKEALAENISKYESKSAGGYNAYNKGTVGNKMIGSDKPIDFSKMSIAEFLKRGELKSGDPDRLFAVGRYQIIPATMKDLVKTMKLDPNTTYLDPATQDALFANGLVGTRRKKVDDYIKGKSNDRDGAILQLSQEFASVGVPYDNPPGKPGLKKGDSYYSGQGGNKAHNSPEEIGAALDMDRAKFVKSSVPSLPNSPVIDASKTNADLNNTLNEKAPQTTISNTVVSSPSQTTISNQPQQKDSNPYIEKSKR